MSRTRDAAGTPPPAPRGSEASLPDADVAELATRGRLRRHGAGGILALEGGEPEDVIVVRRGRVKISCHTEDGHEVLLAVRGPGAVLGELSAIDGEPRTATVTAVEDVEVVSVTAADFHAFLRDRPDAAIALLRALARRLREADRRRVEFVAADSVGRVARLLVELAEKHGEPVVGGGVRLALPLSQHEIAAWTGSSREAVNKALGTLRTRGLVATGRREIVVLDLARLRRRAG